MSCKLVCSILLSLLFLNINFAQERKLVNNASVQASKGKWLGKTEAVRDLVPMKLTDSAKRANKKLDYKQVPNFFGRGKAGQMKEGALPKYADPVRQNSALKSSNRSPEILVNMQGLGNGSPTDPTGDIGKDHYIQMVNATRWQVFDKNGTAVSNPMNLNTLWAPLGQNSFGDPIVIYDQEFDRWILTEFPPSNFFLVAISESSDPLGAYNVYEFATPNFPDYPKYSLWENAICITTNEEGNSVHTTYYIDREDLLNGELNPDIQRISLPGQPGGPGFFVSTPVDWSGKIAPPQGSAPIILSLSDDAWGSSPQDQIDLFHINLDFDTPANSSVEQSSVITAPFQTGNVCGAPGPSFACIPQPNGNGLDGIPETIMNQVHYRNFGAFESIVLNFIVNPEVSEPLAGIRWMELRKTPTTDWSVYQEGTFSPADGENRFMGGIAQDGKGNILLSYVVASSNTFAGIRAVGRYASDPLGQMTTGEIEIVNGLSSGPAGRFGDYAQMSVDPVDDKTFWYTSEYLGPGGNALTRIFSAQFEQDSIDFAATSLVNPISGSDLGAGESVSIEITNVGLTAQQNFDLGYIFENGLEIKDAVDSLILPGQSYVHTFDETEDFDEIRDYNFRIFVSVAMDTFQLNDTLNAIVTKIPQFDAAISNIVADDNLCTRERSIAISISNLGSETITELNLEIDLNGTIFNETFFGNIALGESSNYVFITDQILEGSNNISVRASAPNGQIDQNMNNDSFMTSFEAFPNNVTILLEILTDQFPAETTWEILDQNNEIIYTGGPYNLESTLFTETFCLNPDACYTMNIFDSYSDGICCEFGEGSYQIVTEDGAPLLIGNGDFGASDSNQFCATFVCMLDADISTSPESEAGASDGIITIDAMNAPSALMYSIDGGNSFQEENFFGGLAAGEYAIVVQAEFDCIYTDTVEISACALDVIIEVTDESVIDFGDGSIYIDVMGGNEPLTYSIDAGLNFQSEPEFLNLSNGIYEILVRDDLGCTYQDTVEVSYLTSTDNPNLSKGYHAIVLPNPTSGVFKLLLNFPSKQEIFADVEILNMEGKLVRTAKIARWNDVYEGSFSLVNEPDGVYLLRINDRAVNKLIRVIKQSN